MAYTINYMNSTPPATPPTVFCSYAFTGEDEAVVRARMRGVVAALEQVGCAVYCISSTQPGPATARQVNSSAVR